MPALYPAMPSLIMGAMYCPQEELDEELEDEDLTAVILLSEGERDVIAVHHSLPVQYYPVFPLGYQSFCIVHIIRSIPSAVYAAPHSL